MCKHLKTRIYRTKAGYTEICRRCGKKRRTKLTPITPSIYREYLPVGADVDSQGVMRFNLIDVTVGDPGYKKETGKWGSA